MITTKKNNYSSNSDMKKSVLTLILFFLVTFVYNLLRPLKVTLVVSANGSGAEIIPFLKLWGIVPGAFLLMYLYTRFSNNLSRENVFYAMISLFISFFTIFLFLLYPYREFFELEYIPSLLQERLPNGMHGLILMIRYWHLSLFYIFSELWSTVIISTLLWGFINETTKITKAKKAYGIFALSANLAPIFSGPISYACSCQDITQHFVAFTTDPWQTSLILILTLVLITSCLIIYLYWSLNRTIDKIEPTVTTKTTQEKRSTSTQKTKFSLLDSFAILLQSKYLLCLLVIVVSYNLVFNMTDVLWTHQLALQFKNDANAMNAYLSQVTFIKGLTATFLAIIVTGFLIQKFGWRLSALVTPAIIIITSLAFFPLILFNSHQLNSYFHLGSLEALMGITLFIGSTQNCLTRASKYTLFDATKELSFIPLSVKKQRQAKAVIDGIGSRIGKSGGAVFYQIILLFCTSISSAMPYIILLVIIMLSLWVYAIFGLDKEMKKIL